MTNKAARWVSSKEAGSRYNVTPQTVTRWCREQRVRAKPTPGGCWLVAVDDEGFTLEA